MGWKGVRQWNQEQSEEKRGNSMITTDTERGSMIRTSMISITENALRAVRKS